MADRNQVYAGAVPYETDILSAQRNLYEGLGLALADILGTGTLIGGMSCVATAPASLAVAVGPGRIYSLQSLDSTAFGQISGSPPVGGLPADTNTNHQIVKQGILRDPLTLACPAPGTVGFSVNYLVEAAFNETDTTNIILPFWNATNPNVPLTGPNNLGTALPTIRADQCLVQIKAGTAATTGTQTTPAPDSGFVGLYVITVANGQSTITAGNISALATAPFIATKLPQVRTRLAQNTTLFVAQNGSDTVNSGMSASSPFATLQRAWNFIINSLDMNGFSVTVSVANGTYTAGLNAAGYPVGNTLGAAGISFVGNVGTPSSVIVSVTNSNCFSATNGAQLSASGFQVAATGSGLTGNGIFASSGGSIQYSNMIFAACGNNQVWAAGTSQISCIGNCSITGGALAHIAANSASVLGVNPGVTVTLTGTPAFSTAFANAVTGDLNLAAAVFSGSATGARFSATQNGVINTNGGGATFLPGSVTGTTATGGQYV